MTLIDPAQQNAMLDGYYGAARGSSTPASHTLHLFAGDPAIAEFDGGGVELSAASGYAPVTIANSGANWPPASAGLKTGPAVSWTSTGAWSGGPATHWVLKAPDGSRANSGRLAEEIDITQAGVTKTITPTIYFGSGL